MTDKDKKLAEKILEDTFISSGSFLDVDYIDLYVDAMQAYHEAKMKEVTDKDIEVWVSKHFLHGESAFKGAKAMRNGEIKHIEK